MDTALLTPGIDDAVVTSGGIEVKESSLAASRLRRPDRQQTTLEPCCRDERLPPDHPARTIWKVVEHLDLSAFYVPIGARGSDPGRAATEPKLLVALWLYAAVKVQRISQEGTRVPASAGKSSFRRQPRIEEFLAIDVTNHGCDSGEDRPLREQVKRRTGRTPQEHLLDGGYLKAREKRM